MGTFGNTWGESLGQQGAVVNYGTSEYLDDINNFGKYVYGDVNNIKGTSNSIKVVSDLTKSQALGSDILAGIGNFANATDWTISGTATISEGVARIYSPLGATASIAQKTATLTLNSVVKLDYDVTIDNGGDIASDAFSATLPSVLGANTYSDAVVFTTFMIKRLAVADITIDNLTVRRILGNHLVQATVANRPLQLEDNFYFDGVNDYLFCAVTEESIGSIYIVAQKIGTEQGYSVYNSLSGIGEFSNGILYIGRNAAGTEYYNINIKEIFIRSVVDSPARVEAGNRYFTSKYPQLTDLKFINTGATVFRFIDSDNNMWFTSDSGVQSISYANFLNALSVPVTVNKGTLIADGVTALVNDELHSEFDIGQLSSPITLVRVAGIREMSNGELAMYDINNHFYYTSSNKTIVHTVNIATDGSIFDGWNFYVYNNIILISGYSSSPKGIGKVILSTDYGVTFTTIFDFATWTEISEAARTAGHIHGVVYDHIWDRIYVTLGDFTYLQHSGKIIYCDNYTDETPTWTTLEYNCSENQNEEQYVTIYPMPDRLLFGADMAPTNISSMERVIDHSANTKRNIEVRIFDTITTIPAAFYQYNSSLPVTIFNGMQLLSAQSAPYVRSSLIVTRDGDSFYQIFKDSIKSNRAELNNKIFYLPDGTIIANKYDDRFALNGLGTLIFGKMSKQI